MVQARCTAEENNSVHYHYVLRTYHSRTYNTIPTILLSITGSWFSTAVLHNHRYTTVQAHSTVFFGFCFLPLNNCSRRSLNRFLLRSVTYITYYINIKNIFIF